MELRQLRYFVEVAATGSFNQAAARLHLTQPAVSRQIKALEEELGVALLVRGKRAVTVTQAGQIFYEDAQDLLAQAERIARRARGRRKGETLRVGYVPSLVSAILPKAIARFRELEKGTRVDLVDMTPKEICDRAAKQLIDVAILPRGSEEGLRGAQLIEIARQKPVAVLPRRHPLARLSRIPPKALAQVPLFGLGRTEFPEYAPRVRAILKPFGVTPQFVSQAADGIASLFAEMIAEEGAAVLTDAICDALPADLVARPFSPALPPLVILAAVFVTRPGLNAEGFVRILEEEGRKAKGGGRP